MIVQADEGHFVERNVLQGVRTLWSHLDDEQFDALLWSCSSYPCGSIEDEAKELTELHARHNGDFQAAMDEAYKALDDAMAEHNRIKNEDTKNS